MGTGGVGAKRVLAGETQEVFDKPIETVIDKFYDLVVANKSISGRQAASTLSLSEAQVEKLSKLLDDAGLVSTGYSLSELVISIPSEQQPQKKQEAKSAADPAGDALFEVSRSRKVLEFAKKQSGESLALLHGVSTAPAQKVAEALEQARISRQCAADIVRSCEETERALSAIKPSGAAGPSGNASLMGQLADGLSANRKSAAAAGLKDGVLK